jgi:hypothetical protein
MQTSKSFLVLCAVAYCAALMPLHAADTDAQIKAREALEKKLSEMQGQSPAPATPPTAVTAQPKAQPAPTPAPAPPKKTPPPASTTPASRSTPPAQPVPPPAAPAAPAATAPPMVRTPPVQPAPAPPQSARPVLAAPPQADSASIAKAREALRQKMVELEGQTAPAVTPPVVTAPPPQPVVTAPPPQPVVTAPPPQPVVAAPPPPTTTAAPMVTPRAATPSTIAAPVAQPVPAPAPAAQLFNQPVLAGPAPSDPESIAKARAAMEERMKLLAAQPPPPQVSLAPPWQKPVPKPSGHSLASFPPLQAPPPVVSTAKRQRLDDLLLRYKADMITPEQYHEQRAKIIAEP